MATTNYSWNLPTVGGSEDTWGTSLNANWTALDTLLGGVSQAEFAKLDGLTASTAELNILDGVTANAAELNVLDGISASTAELNYAVGVTSSIQTQLNSKASTSTSISTGSGLTGGGNLTTSRTLSVSFSANQAEVKTAINASGSAPIYACRAWVNFNGQGSISIRASGNVSSITDNGVGNYIVNFSVSMPDANIATVGLGSGIGNPTDYNNFTVYSQTASSVQVRCRVEYTGGAGDPAIVNVAVFR